MGIFLKDMSLKGKTALITGATKGLGRGAAEAIAEAGGNIIAIGRNQFELNSLGKKIKRGIIEIIGGDIGTLWGITHYYLQTMFKSGWKNWGSLLLLMIIRHYLPLRIRRRFADQSQDIIVKTFFCEEKKVRCG